MVYFIPFENTYLTYNIQRKSSQERSGEYDFIGIRQVQWQYNFMKLFIQFNQLIQMNFVGNDYFHKVDIVILALGFNL